MYSNTIKLPWGKWNKISFQCKGPNCLSSLIYRAITLRKIKTVTSNKNECLKTLRKKNKNILKVLISTYYTNIFYILISIT